VSRDCAGPEGGSRKWRTPEGIHIDVRGLPPPQPAVETLQLVDSEEADAVLTARLDREPIFLYPELDDRGGSFEIVPASCGDAACEDEVRLRLVRWGR
jgi:hypothetical protein